MAEEQSRAQQLVGDIAPKLAELTDEVLFGDVWSRPGLSRRDRSLITVAALTALGRTDQLRSHLGLALNNGVTQDELAEVATHLAFYAHRLMVRGCSVPLGLAQAAAQLRRMAPPGRTGQPRAILRPLARPNDGRSRSARDHGSPSRRSPMGKGRSRSHQPSAVADDGLLLRHRHGLATRRRLPVRTNVRGAHRPALGALTAAAVPPPNRHNCRARADR
jgi:4-carboxymuconolactone decarboxylase